MDEKSESESLFEARRRINDALYEEPSPGCLEGVPAPQADAIVAFFAAREEALREQRCIEHAAVSVVHGDCPICDVEQADERIEALRAALAKAIEVIEWCGLNDRTPVYAYGEAQPSGDLPPKGATFNTPAEFARYWPAKLREVLDA